MYEAIVTQRRVRAERGGTYEDMGTRSARCAYSNREPISIE